MPLPKPARVASDPVMSAKWDEVTAGRKFCPSDTPTVQLLCYWHAVVDRCQEDLSAGGEVHVAYSNDMNDIKELPQIGTLKKASAEIRALNKQLGITDGRDVGGADGDDDEAQTVLKVVQGRGAGARRASAG